ncbi:MAG: RluA family pseudouridine synthase [Methyloligellaceae bacterium]
MTGVQTKEVKDEDDGMRLDRWFKTYFPDIGFGHLQKILRKGQVRVDGSRAKASTRLESGQTIRIPPVMQSPVEPVERAPDWISHKDTEFVQSLVIHKDEDVIAINKPAGLAVQGGTKTDKHLDGLLEGLKFERDDRPKLVHRLDKDTSGVLLLARHRKAATALGKALSDHKARKIYWALVNGVPRYDAGEINRPLIKRGGMGDERIRVAERDDPDAMKAITEYELVETAGQKFAWLAMMPITGRTHQLRVHSVALGHPIVGDGKYGGSDAHPGGEIPKQLHLHARSIEIPHPRKGVLKLQAKMPGHMEKTWKLLNFPEEAGEIVFEK